MTPLGRRLWKMLPINVWVSRSELKEKFLTNGFQNAITDLYNSGCIELEFRGITNTEQLIRRKTSTEIAEFYCNHLTNPKSPHYNKRIFWEMQVRCSVRRKRISKN